MTNKQISDLCFTDLVQIMLTDGNPKQVKEKALEELLDRKYDEGWESARQEYM